MFSFNSSNIVPFSQPAIQIVGSGTSSHVLVTPNVQQQVQTGITRTTVVDGETLQMVQPTNLVSAETIMDPNAPSSNVGLYAVGAVILFCVAKFLKIF